MGLLRIIDDVTSYITSDIKAQTGKGFFQTFTDNGNYGEFQSYKYLFMTPGKRLFIHNCYLPVVNGSTEIDLLMIHETGLYVIESKNYSGWIFGDEKQKEWTQILAGGKQKNRFFNPIWQNAGHIKALRTFFIEYPDLPIFSLVVFSERCDLKKVSIYSDGVIVIKRNQLKSVFKRQIKDKEKCSPEMLINIYQRLLPLCKKDQAEKQQHIDRINGLKHATIDSSDGVKPEEMVNEIATLPTNTEIIVVGEEISADVEIFNSTQSDEKAELSEEPDTCPKCSAKLVKRNGKNGPFIGCSNFPKCRYTSSV